MLIEQLFSSRNFYGRHYEQMTLFRPLQLLMFLYMSYVLEYIKNTMKTVFLSQKLASQIVYKFVCFVKSSSSLAFAEERSAGTILGYVNPVPFIRFFYRYLSTTLPLFSKTLCINPSLRIVKLENYRFRYFCSPSYYMTGCLNMDALLRVLFCRFFYSLNATKALS
jgi:hypothetical protein